MVRAVKGEKHGNWREAGRKSRERRETSGENQWRKKLPEVPSKLTACAVTQTPPTALTEY